MTTLSESLLVGDSLVHRLPSHLKVVATTSFVVAVALTPREAVLAFALYAVMLVGAAAAAGLTPRRVLPRMVVEVPFVVFALLLPLLGGGEQVQVLGLSLSVPGLWAAWNILAKATLGVLAAVVLASTTAPADLVDGLHRLRLPTMIVQIATFMIRYVDVVADDLARMRVALRSRGLQERHLGHAGVIARTAGTVFVRTYERGERVHLAMLSRGYSGTMPVPDTEPVPGRQWWQAFLLPALAWAVLLAALAT